MTKQRKIDLEELSIADLKVLSMHIDKKLKDLKGKYDLDETIKWIKRAVLVISEFKKRINNINWK
jgi:hypothetical protein